MPGVHATRQILPLTNLLTNLIRVRSDTSKSQLSPKKLYRRCVPKQSISTGVGTPANQNTHIVRSGVRKGLLVPKMTLGPRKKTVRNSQDSLLPRSHPSTDHVKSVGNSLLHLVVALTAVSCEWITRREAGRCVAEQGKILKWINLANSSMCQGKVYNISKPPLPLKNRKLHQKQESLGSPSRRQPSVSASCYW